MDLKKVKIGMEREINWNLIAKWITDLLDLQDYIESSPLVLLHHYRTIQTEYEKLIEIEIGQKIYWLRKFSSERDPFMMWKHISGVLQRQPLNSFTGEYSSGFICLLCLYRRGVPSDVITMIYNYIYPWSKGPIVRGEQWYYKKPIDP